MSSTFDARAVAARLHRKQEIELAESLAGRLMDGDSYEALVAVFETLESEHTEPRKKRSEAIPPVTIRAYGRDGERNRRPKAARKAAVVYDFPGGASVTRLRRAPLTFRVEDTEARQLIIRRARRSPKDDWHWEVMNSSGFKARSGRRAGARLRGHGPSHSFD